FKGMGSFTMIPLPGKRYRAEVMVANQFSMEAELPTAQAEGVAMAIAKKGNDQLGIKISEQTVSTNNASAFTIVGRAAGEVFYKKEIGLENGVSNLELKKDILPAGIIQFTLFDNNLVPRCERLVFANTPEVINVSIKPEEGEYSRRGKVNMDIEAFDAKDNPCRTNLSVSAYHPETQLKMEEYPNNILSQFVLGSELKGIIEEPGYYFKDDSISTQTALDNLMLTHGWRHFEWKEIEQDKMLSMEYPAEESIQLRGSVKNYYTKKPISNGTVTMMTIKSLLSVKDQKTDSLGRFIFPDLYFNDTVKVTLQAENKKGKMNTIIELDKRSSISPAAHYLPVTYQYKQENQETTTDYLSTINPQVINRKWHLSDTILLNQVNVHGYKQKKNDGLVRMYGDADFVFDMDKQDNVYSSVFDAIDGKIPGVILDQATDTFRARGQTLLIYLDGIRVDDPYLLSTFSSNLFDKVEYVKMGITAGINYPGGILYFYMKRGKMFENVNNLSMGIKGDDIIGYSVIRQFYSPKYNPEEVPENRNDFRNTLYWNPVLQTDSTGMANLSYFNSDQTGEVEVVVEGVTSDGKLCRGSCKYNVIP
ncbi:MAG TPA: Plug domain-containing protein, partial [Prolixibacteraceae bacterium]|nr:Plug domain-containing protein [Prolixibacteraceae bacterium]